MTNNVSTWDRLEERYWFSVLWRAGKPVSRGVGAWAVTISGSLRRWPVTAKFQSIRCFSGRTPAEVKARRPQRSAHAGGRGGQGAIFGHGYDGRSEVCGDCRSGGTRGHLDHCGARCGSAHMTPVGISVGDLNDGQRGALVKLIRHYVFRAADEMAQNYWNQLEKRRLGQFALRMGGAVGAVAGPLLQHPSRQVRDRVRQHAKRCESHPLGVARLHA